MNMDACTDDQKVNIKKFQEMGASALEANVTQEVKVLQEATQQHDSEIKRLTDEFDAFKTEKTGMISMMKAAFSFSWRCEGRTLRRKGVDIRSLLLQGQTGDRLFHLSA
jgi:hypothetical protein